MHPRTLTLLGLVACTSQVPTVLIDSGQADAAVCAYESSYFCDYRANGIVPSCTDYSSQAFDYLDAELTESSGRGLAETCTAAGRTWGEGSCPMDDTWVGVCVDEVGGTIGLIFGTHYYSEPALEFPDGTVIIYDDESASESCYESAGAEWCNDGAE